tara:strand:+ start:163 stop:1203 length:1041 start_codon:yes stop_codon:yes gene_type:complete
MNIGINGLGRIGKSLLRIIFENPKDNINVVAIKDYNSFSVKNEEYIKNIAYLLQNDSIYGQFPFEVNVVDNNYLLIDDKKIPVFLEKNIQTVDWNKLGCDVIVEASGTIDNIDYVKDTLGDKVKKAIITRGVKNVDFTYVRGVNDADFDLNQHHIISASTCTGNAFAPFAKFVDTFYGIKQGSVCTIHPVLSSEKMIDGFNKSFQLGRAGKSVKLIPTAIANSTLDVLPQLRGKIMEKSLSYRIPTDIVSSIYGVLLVRDEITTDRFINDLKSEIEKDLKGVLELCEGSFGHSKVSIDFLKNKHSAIIDENWIQIDGNLLQFHLWHDNEYGYTMRVYDLLKKLFLE